MPPLRPHSTARGSKCKLERLCYNRLVSVRRLLLALWATPCAASWAGLGYLIFGTSPQGNLRQLFFAALFLAASTTAMPAAYYLQGRFAGEGPQHAELLRSLREGILAGLLLLLWAWLQMVRALNWMNGVILLGIFISLELFLLAKG